MEENFKWTDQLVLDFVRFTLDESNAFQSRYTDLEQFKERQQVSVKKEWEILSFDRGASYRRCVLNNDGEFYVWEGNEDQAVGSTLDEMLKSKNNFKIYSVKRLSDNVVFSIGDGVDTKATDSVEFKSGSLCSGVIREIVIDDKLTFVIDTISGEVFRKYIQNIRHSQIVEPLFVTEDGEKVYDGEKIVWYIDERCKLNTRKAKNVFKSSKCLKIYSNSDAAYEYIFLNKQCLSVNDVMKLDLDLRVSISSAMAKEHNITDDDDCVCFLEKSLKELAEKKLNQ